MATKKLSNTQLEILKLFQYDIPEEQWKEIENMLVQYFNDKASDETDRLWDERGWSDETMEKWANEHMRKIT